MDPPPASFSVSGRAQPKKQSDSGEMFWQSVEALEEERRLAKERRERRSASASAGASASARQRPEEFEEEAPLLQVPRAPRQLCVDCPPPKPVADGNCVSCGKPICAGCTRMCMNGCELHGLDLCESCLSGHMWVCTPVPAESGVRADVLECQQERVADHCEPHEARDGESCDSQQEHALVCSGDAVSASTSATARPLLHVAVSDALPPLTDASTSSSDESRVVPFLVDGSSSEEETRGCRAMHSGWILDAFRKNCGWILDAPL